MFPAPVVEVLTVFRVVYVFCSFAFGVCFFGAMSYGLIFCLCLLHLSTSWIYSATLFSLWCQA